MRKYLYIYIYAYVCVCIVVSIRRYPVLIATSLVFTIFQILPPSCWRTSVATHTGPTRLAILSRPPPIHG